MRSNGTSSSEPTSTPTLHFPPLLLKELRSSLDRALTALNADRPEPPLQLKSDAAATRSAPAPSPFERTFSFEGPEDFCVRVRVSAFLLSAIWKPNKAAGPITYEVYVAIEDGPTRRLIYRRPAMVGATPEPANEDPNSQDPPAAPSSFDRNITAFVREEIESRLQAADLVHRPSETCSPVAPPHVPRLTLNREGDIRGLNRAACRALEIADDEQLSSRSFFSLIDGRNLRRVMWDLARMIKRKVQGARWLLRLRTGNDRWRWYRVAANNKLRFEGIIQLTLRPLGSAA